MIVNSREIAEREKGSDVLKAVLSTQYPHSGERIYSFIYNNQLLLKKGLFYDMMETNVSEEGDRYIEYIVYVLNSITKEMLEDLGLVSLFDESEREPFPEPNSDEGSYAYNIGYIKHFSTRHLLTQVAIYDPLIGLHVRVGNKILPVISTSRIRVNRISEGTQLIGFENKAAGGFVVVDVERDHRVAVMDVLDHEEGFRLIDCNADDDPAQFWFAIFIDVDDEGNPISGVDYTYMTEDGDSRTMMFNESDFLISDTIKTTDAYMNYKTVRDAYESMCNILIQHGNAEAAIIDHILSKDVLI